MLDGKGSGILRTFFWGSELDSNTWHCTGVTVRGDVPLGLHKGLAAVFMAFLPDFLGGAVSGCFRMGLQPAFSHYVLIPNLTGLGYIAQFRASLNKPILWWIVFWLSPLIDLFLRLTRCIWWEVVPLSKWVISPLGKSVRLFSTALSLWLPY